MVSLNVSLDPIQSLAVVPCVGLVSMVACVALKALCQLVKFHIPLIGDYSFKKLALYAVPILGTIAVIFDSIVKKEHLNSKFTKDGMPIMDPVVAATLYRMLKEFDEVCTEKGVHYMACSGTALGAIRQKPPGIIPWDDDIDLVLPVSEEKKFDQSFHDLLNTRGLKLRSHWGGFKLSLLTLPSFGVTYGPKDDEFYWPFIDVFITFENSLDHRIYIDCSAHPELDPKVPSTIWPKESWTHEDFLSAKRVPFGPLEVPLMIGAKDYCIAAYGKECMNYGRQLFDHKNGKPFAFALKKRLTDFSSAAYDETIWKKPLI